MKRIAITLLATIAITSVNAQIGGGLLNKAKDKANKAADKATTPSNTNSGSNKENTKPANDTKPASTTAPASSSKPASSGSNTKGKSSATNPWGTGSPASYEITTLKSTMEELKTKHGNAWYSEKIDDVFDRARGYIAKIKTKDTEWDIAPEEKLVNEYWDVYKSLAGDLKKDDAIAEIIDDVEDATKDNEAIGVAGNYVEYAAYRDEYAKKSAENKTKTDNADKYFNDLLPTYLEANLLAELKTDMPSFDEDKNKMNPRQSAYTLSLLIEKIDKALKAVKTGTTQETELKKHHAAYTAEKAKFEKFESSGEFDTFKATKAADIVAKTRWTKTVATDAKLETGAKNAITNYYSDKVTFLRSGMTSDATNWGINRFPSGTPNYRTKVAMVGFKKGDKCYVAQVFIKERYSFGKWTGDLIYQYSGDAWEILCENMSK